MAIKHQSMPPRLPAGRGAGVQPGAHKHVASTGSAGCCPCACDDVCDTISKEVTRTVYTGAILQPEFAVTRSLGKFP